MSCTHKQEILMVNIVNQTIIALLYEKNITSLSFLAAKATCFS